MFLVPMGEDNDNENNRSGFYKSANVGDIIDVNSQDEYEADDDVLPTDLDLYKRITKRWLTFQEIGGFTLLVTIASSVFILLRSANYFALVVVLLVISIAFVMIMFVFSWRELRRIDKIRYFFAVVGVGLAAAVSGHDIMATWMTKNQQITNGVITALVAIGVFVAYKAASDYFTRKKRRY